MSDEKIKVLIVDDDKDFSEFLREYINNQEGLEVISLAQDGKEALRKIVDLMPDVVILDIIMPQLDGFGVLEIIRGQGLKKRPIFIVLSALSQDKEAKRALKLGAEYYLVKPFNFEVLVRRIKELSKEKKELIGQYLHRYSLDCSVKEIKDLEEEITDLMHEVGIPAHLKGYYYLRDAIKMAVKDLDVVSSMTKELYPKIAKSYDTTASCVERAMRHAITLSLNRGRADTINSMFGYTISKDKGKPTNSEFIALIADKLRIEMNMAGI